MTNGPWNTSNQRTIKRKRSKGQRTIHIQEFESFRFSTRQSPQTSMTDSRKEQLIAPSRLRPSYEKVRDAFHVFPSLDNFFIKHM